MKAAVLLSLVFPVLALLDDAKASHAEENNLKQAQTSTLLVGFAAQCGNVSWQTNLTEKQFANMEHDLDALHKQAEHEYYYAKKDGEKELQERKDEYARKECKLLAKHKRIALNNTQQAKTESVESTLLISLAASANESWEKNLTAEQSSKLAKELAALHKHAEHEYIYAEKDGDKELQERKEEYARKERNLLAKYKRIALNLTQQAENESVESMLLFSSLASESANESWQQNLTEEQRATLAKERVELRKHAEHEYYYAKMDGEKELQERKDEYARKERNLLTRYKRIALNLTQQAENESVESTLLISLMASANESWQKNLTEAQFSNLTKDLEALHKHAEHEYHFAKKDGEKELQERKDEYARKERNLLARYKRIALNQTQQAEAESVESTLLFSLMANESLNESWQKNLTEEQFTKLAKKLEALHKHAEHEYNYAKEDGEKELQERKDEYERKERTLLARYKRIAMNQTQQSEAETVESTLLLSLTTSQSANESWQKNLTEAQFAKLEKRLQALHKHAEHEYQYAKNDGEKELQERRDEYARKERNLLAEYKRIAMNQTHQAENESVESILLISLAADQDANESWQTNLTEMQRARLAKERAALHKHAEHELYYAKKDGEDELQERKDEYARKERKLEAKYKRIALNQTQQAENEIVESTILMSSDADQGANESWQQNLTVDQRSKLAKERAELHKQAEHEYYYAKKDGEKELQERKDEYERKARKLTNKYKAIAANMTVQTENPMALNLLLVTVLESDVNDSASSNDSWKSALTPSQLREFEYRQAKLHKYGEHEFYYAALDGKRELEERKAEYRRKEQNLEAKYERIAANNTAQAAAARNGSNSGASQPLNPNAQPSDSSKDSTSDSSTSWPFALASTQMLLASAQSNLNASSSFEWQQRLNASMQDAQQDELEKLHEHCEHEFHYASLDGQKELRERQQECARKERHILARYKKLAISADVVTDAQRALMSNYAAVAGAFAFGVVLAASITMRVKSYRPATMKIPLLAEV